MRCFRPASNRELPVRAERRRGFAVVTALVCLLIVVSIMGSMIQGAIRARRQMHVERDRRQSEMLLFAGATRAMSRLESEPTYVGDVWQLPADAIVGNGAGRVTCEISRIAGDGLRQLRVVAEYPVDRDFPIRRSQSFEISADPIP
jgi:hypothetical protein